MGARDRFTDELGRWRRGWLLVAIVLCVTWIVLLAVVFDWPNQSPDVQFFGGVFLVAPAGLLLLSSVFELLKR